jgi:8-oxo-dGTP pyrophosphatase MutT (NUDIX family)
VTNIDLLKDNLPDCPNILGKNDYRNTAILVLLAFLNGEYHFIFQKRGPNVRQNGEVSFPGGGCHPEDVSVQATAVRETVEEMGIPADRLNIIGQLDTLIAPLGATVDAFVAIADIRGLDEFRPNADEVSAVFSVPVSFFETHEPQRFEAALRVHPSVIDEETGEETVLFPARELGLPERYARPWGNLRHTILLYRVGQETIWGVTARFVADVVARIAASGRPAAESASPGGQ